MISKRDIKLYLCIILFCALVSMIVVFATELITDRLPRTVDRIENEYIRDAAEKATGKKIDDIALERIKNEYEKGQETRP
ncbi:MAG: hypothetical protein ACMUIS_10220 [bacterium]